MTRLFRSLILPAQTAHATANTHKTIAHGLVDHAGRKLAPTAVFISPRAANATTVAETVTAHVVSFDNTNVVIKSNTSNAVVDIILHYQASPETFPS